MCSAHARRKALAGFARLFDARIVSAPDLMAGRGSKSISCVLHPVPASPAQGASMSFLDNIKDDIVFLRGAFRALQDDDADRQESDAGVSRS